MTATIVEERLRSAFTMRHERRLRAWVGRLNETPGTIVAIARKGPRLLELLVREGLAGPHILDRLTSEFGLALLRENLSQIVIVDDSVINGSTFSFIYHAAKSLQELRGRHGASIVGLPFALGTQARHEFSADIKASFISLTDDEISPFVASEVSAFRILGKPHELEHPAVVFEDDEISVHSTRRLFLDDLAASIGGRLVTVAGNIITSKGVETTPSYAIVLPEARSSRLGLDFEKLRIFFDPTDSRRMVVTAIAPGCRTLEDSDRAGEQLPGELRSIWEDVKQRLSPILDYDEKSGSNKPGLGKLSKRCWVVWASYLREAELLQEAITCAAQSWPHAVPLAARTIPSDVRLVAGQELELSVCSRLETFFSGGATPRQRSPDVSNCPGPVQLIPPKYSERYEELVTKMVSHARTEEEVLRGIFHSQHIAIECPSRSEPPGRDGSRLDFGSNVADLLGQVGARLPRMDPARFHAALDTLVDMGAAVPRFVQLKVDGKLVWVRVYRAGEVGNTPRIHVLRLAFERLALHLNTTSVPATLLEKLCVMLLTTEHRDPRLYYLATLGIQRGFHLYGARAAFEMEKPDALHAKPAWLIGWARQRKVLIRPPQERETESHRNVVARREESGSYQLHPHLSSTYPPGENPLQEGTRDAIDDIARFVALLHQRPALRTDALVTITSVATERDLHRALSAELRLWLDDERCSVYHVMQALSSALALARVRPLHAGELQVLDNLLSANANISAQSRKKLALFSNRQSMFASVAKAAESEEYTTRVWRDLYRIIQDRDRTEKESSGVKQIRSGLAVAGRITSLLRDLLALGGHNDPRAGRVQESASELREVIDTGTFRGQQVVDPIVLNFLQEHGVASKVIPALTAIIESDDISFIRASELIFPVVRGLAEKLIGLHEAFGAEPAKLKFEVLEPPRYVVLWDIRKSVQIEDQDERNRLLRLGNDRIALVLRDRCVAFAAHSLDDGNGLITSRFADLLTAFRILKETYGAMKIKFRMGCDVNVQGVLRYFPDPDRNQLDREAGTYGGRVYESTARLMSLFKAIAADPSRWRDGNSPVEPDESYLVAGEIAMRYGIQELEPAWPPEDLVTTVPSGTYLPDIYRGIAIGVAIFQ